VLHQIAPSLLFQLFHTDPHLGIRFYKFLATKLCKRLLAHDQVRLPKNEIILDLLVLTAITYLDLGAYDIDAAQTNVGC
jgi:hypothetical protein